MNRFAANPNCRSIFGLLAFISLKLDWLLITLVGAGLTGTSRVLIARNHT